MRVLITGSRGFIGKNLIPLLLSKHHSIIELTKKDKISEINFNEVDFIFHLAGENKNDDYAQFTENNITLTKNLINKFKDLKKHIPIIFSSSIQAENDSIYGKSKLAAENLLIDYYENSNLLNIYRLNNIFGKWSQPNYNSFVATFAHNISRNLPIQIDDKEIELTYIDDLVNRFESDLNYFANNGFFKKNKKIKTYRTSVSYVADKFYYFQNARANNSELTFITLFDKFLYSTFISYLPPDNFFIKTKSNLDDRGNFLEFFKNSRIGSFSFITCKAFKTRGNHFHFTKVERFLVVKGEITIEFNDIYSSKKIIFNLSEKNLDVIETIPGWNHKIVNNTNMDAIIFAWTNEIFDKNNPDTYNFNDKYSSLSSNLMNYCEK